MTTDTREALPPMEQLIGFVEWERKHNPGKKHVADWALAEIERLSAALATQPAQPSKADKVRAIAADFPDKLFTGFSNLMESAKNTGSPEDVAYIKSLRDLFSEVVRAFVHCPPAVQPSAQGEAVAWLVEWKAHGHGPQWWGFNHTPGKNATWCSDANNAIRFARKEDAERMRLHVIAVAGLTGMHSYERSVSVTEHMWIDTASAPAAPASAQGEATQAENAARYLYIREQHWSTSDICCVTKPKDNLLLGSWCPHGQFLDDYIDERRKK